MTSNRAALAVMLVAVYAAAIVSGQQAPPAGAAAARAGSSGALAESAALMKGLSDALAKGIFAESQDGKGEVKLNTAVTMPSAGAGRSGTLPAHQIDVQIGTINKKPAIVTFQLPEGDTKTVSEWSRLAQTKLDPRIQSCAGPSHCVERDKNGKCTKTVCD